MSPQRVHELARSVWELAAMQHGVVARRQLLERGWRPEAINRRLANGRLHSVWRGVYAVGRPELTAHGTWIAAVLTCGSSALLSHASAAELWGIRRRDADTTAMAVEVSVPARRRVRRTGIRVHRVTHRYPGECRVRHHIPVTSPIRTIVDLASSLTAPALERAINEADRLDLVDPVTLRAAIEGRSGERGVTQLRRVLDYRTFALTDSELEWRFFRLVRRSGLPLPRTRESVNGFRVDFFWPELGLIVETDGLRYHRTPAQQARDRLRDQAHAAAGLTALRFTHAQVQHEPEHVLGILRSVAAGRRLPGLFGCE